MVVQHHGTTQRVRASVFLGFSLSEYLITRVRLFFVVDEDGGRPVEENPCQGCFPSPIGWSMRAPTLNGP